MRLIDAETCEVVSWYATGNKDYDAGFDDGAVFVIEKIDNAPTIDAIPVEWLKAHADNIAVKGTLAIWHKEQEA